MRLLPTLLISLICTAAFAQEIKSIKKDIDSEVQRIDSSRLAPITFTIQAMKKVFHNIAYRYAEDRGGYVTISRQFSQSKDTIQQTFYLRKGQLIFATETITSFYHENNATDTIVWSGGFYFSNGKLIDYSTLGHGKSELESWDPQHSMLNALKESKADIGRYKMRKPKH